MDFTYKARDKSGELVKGALSGTDHAEVTRSLERMGYAVLNLQSRAVGPLEAAALHFRKIDRQEVIVFTRQLSTLLHAGMPLSPALDTICEQTVNPKFQKILMTVKTQVQSGKSFSSALAEHPRVFSALFISMIRVGETAGILDEILSRLALLGTQEMEMVSRVRSAFVYPAVLVGVALVIVNFLFIAVLPQFVTVFEASQIELPLPTKVVLGISWVFRRLWPAVLAASVAGGYLLRRYTQTERGKTRAHGLVLKLPVLGGLYMKILVSRFARTLSALTASGIPLVGALEVVERTIPNVVFQRVLRRIQTALKDGSPLVDSFKVSGFFSPMVIQMISTGEKTGKLDAMLEQVGEFYEPEIEYTVKNLTTLLEPFMLVMMGGMVAFIALSVLMPIFNLMQSFKG
jgi:type IV pilus assembly protein PilC